MRKHYHSDVYEDPTPQPHDAEELEVLRLSGLQLLGLVAAALTMVGTLAVVLFVWPGVAL